MRHVILFAALASTVVSLNFLEKAHGFLSGASSSASASANANASVSAGSESAGVSNFFSGLQNSSFGQAVAGGVDFYNNVKNGNGTEELQASFANSTIGGYIQTGVDYYNNAKNGNGSFIDTDTIQKHFANSTFGEVVQSGVNYFNNLKNGGNVSDVMGNFVPFLANASSEAKAEFALLLPKVSNMTITEFETAVNAWAAKYGLTAEVNAFNERHTNATADAEEHANSVVMNLPNVLNNLKAISSDKNQTFEQMHSRMFNYVTSLDEDTYQIVVVLFTNMLPPQLKQAKCTGGNFISNVYQKASNFFGGEGGNNTNNSSFPFGNFFHGNGTSAKNGTNHPNFGILTNFLNKNNLTENDVTNALGNAQSDTASIQILPAPLIHTAESTATPKKNKKPQANKKKTTTTAAPDDAAEVHTQVL